MRSLAQAPLGVYQEHDGPRRRRLPIWMMRPDLVAPGYQVERMGVIYRPFVRASCSR